MRGLVGLATAPSNEWEARYIHSDCSPMYLGKTLYNEYHRHYKDNGGVQALGNYLLAEQSGWSVLAGCDLTLQPQWLQESNPHNSTTDYDAYLKWWDDHRHIPQSYSARGETDYCAFFNTNPADESEAEWGAIILNPFKTTIDFYKPSGSRWRLVCSTPLDAPAPDWASID